MAGEIQTSFIPKTSLAGGGRRPEVSVGIFTTLAIIVLLTAALFYGGALGYQGLLSQQQTSLQVAIADKQKDIPSDKLQAMERLNTQLTQATSLVNNHIAASNLFSFLQDNTISTVRYTSFALSGGEAKIKGLARSYEDIARQAQILKAAIKGTGGEEGKIRDAIFSDFTLDQKGNVTFNLTLMVKPALLKYSPPTISATTTNP